MKKMLAVCLALLMILALPFSRAEEENGISPEELQAWISTHVNLNLLDVRGKDAFSQAHLPMAMSFPLDTLKEELQAILDGGFSYMAAEMVVYGETEEQGAAAAEILRELGFTNVFVFPGMDQWAGKLFGETDEMRLLGTLDTVDIEGKAADLSLLQPYRLTLVNVWATYCGPCISEMPELGRLSEEMKEEGVQIIGLVSDAMDGEILEANEAVLEKARQIIQDTGADYPHLLPDASLTRNLLYQISAVPTTFFVDQTGDLVGYVYQGSRDYDAWKAIIEETLALLP